MRHPIRVLHVTYSMALGGLEVFVRNLLAELDKSLCAPSLCAFVPGGDLFGQVEQLGIPVHNLNSPQRGGLSRVLRIRRLLRDRSIDVVHTHNLEPWLFGGLAALLRGGTPVVHTEHSYKQYYSRRRWVAAGTLLGRLSRAVIADSQDVAAFLRGRLGVPEPRLRVIYNGVETETFRRARKDGKGPALRAALTLPQEVLVVGVVARLVPIKNHALLLRAFQRVAGLALNARLLVVGDGPLRESLEALAGSLALGTRVRFLGQRDDIPAIMAACDVFCLPSLSEGCSITLLEAMAAGLPVVCTRVGGNGELVEDGRTGLLVPSEEPEALAAALARLLADPAGRMAMGRNGLERVEQQFSLAGTARRYEAVYHEVVA